MRKLMLGVFLSILVGFMIFGMIGVVSAVPAAPSPTCKINAKIINATYKEAYFQEDNGLPCNAGGINISAKYLLTFKINQISTVNQEGDRNCNELYPINSEQIITIYKTQVNSGDVFEKDQIIDGNIHFSGDECGSGIYLSDYKINRTEDNLDCKNLYWFDDTTKVCTQKQFCGAYMYLGLQTFNSKTQCENALNETKNNIEKPKNITFIPWQKRNASECPMGCKCVGAVVSCTTADGKTMTIEAGRSGNIITITVNKKEANTTLELETEADSNNKTKIKAVLSNGRKSEIKIMPNTASATAIAKLGDLGFTIELKEVGKETKDTKDDKVVYELTGNKEGKFLGIFKIIAKVQAQVDAETGKVEVIKPWWSFLAGI